MRSFPAGTNPDRSTKAAVYLGGKVGSKPSQYASWSSCQAYSVLTDELPWVCADASCMLFTLVSSVQMGIRATDVRLSAAYKLIALLLFCRAPAR